MDVTLRHALPAEAVAGHPRSLYGVLLAWMSPRDPRVAARTVSALCAVGVLVTVVTLPLAPEQMHGAHPVLTLLTYLALGVTGLMSAAAWFFDEASRFAWAFVPVSAIAVIVFVDLATVDASVSAQIFFVFPVVYGASMLRRPGAVLLLALSLAGEVVVVAALLSPREAVVDVCYLAAALTTVAVTLLRGAERQAALVAELGRLAVIDPLTGLVTRRAFDRALEEVLSHPSSEEGTSLLLIDVDEFKSVNDRFGHPGGDTVLVQLSELLVEASRRGDIVCRLGGDEMAVLLPRCSYEAALRRAEEITELVRSHGFRLDVDDLIRVSVSAGLAHAPTHGADARALYVAADAALYEAKRGGRDRAVAHPLPAA